MAEIIVTSENFDKEVLLAACPVLLDFWATWCGPCKLLAPVIDEIAEEYDNNLKVCKVNVDEYPDLAIRFGIDSIPTLLYFKNGKLENKLIGYCPKERIKAILD